MTQSIPHKDILSSVATAFNMVAATIAEVNDSGNDGCRVAVDVAMGTLGPQGMVAAALESLISDAEGMGIDEVEAEAAKYAAALWPLVQHWAAAVRGEPQ